MILVDSSVWIDYFRGSSTPEADRLDALLGAEPLLVGDLILAEVLQGFTTDRDFNQARRLMASFQIIDLVGQGIAIQAARHFRMLRQCGVTIRKTVDTLIATRCIQDDFALLYSDRDFDPFVAHIGLRSALHER
ncbi:type II toxin-antitoxin system VapC family toxin [Nitrococcus mobilis]|uniref:Ribonuclease VapC n=1 Tax=Nitrococcus mobilis Nb-231 TaxID=314278 RepID=A4BVI4_9GAMM|nr:PIN domain nuclease [Nitrococcus mobilis]EAR20249.1 PilT protein-like [Nitrococcus mobilis Nb-231]